MIKVRFETKELILIALFAAMGLAIKPLVKLFTGIITTPLGIPGGTISGGFYMMWLSLPMAVTKKFGAATLTGLLQGLTVLITGWFGTHGAISLVTYSLPGLIIDFLGTIYKRYDRIDGQMVYCLIANLSGTWLVGLIIMRLPKEPLFIAMILSLFSGLLGGLISYTLYKKLKSYNLL